MESKISVVLVTTPRLGHDEEPVLHEQLAVLVLRHRAAVLPVRTIPGVVATVVHATQLSDALVIMVTVSLRQTTGVLNTTTVSTVYTGPITIVILLLVAGVVVH